MFRAVILYHWVSLFVAVLILRLNILPLKLQPYGTVQICFFFLLLFFIFILLCNHILCTKYCQLCSYVKRQA